MKIRKELIGSKVFHKVLNKYIEIEEGKEETYQKLGMDIFEETSKPKLQRNKNAKNTKRRNNDNNANVDGAGND